MSEWKVCIPPTAEESAAWLDYISELSALKARRDGVMHNAAAYTADRRFADRVYYEAAAEARARYDARMSALAR